MARPIVTREAVFAAAAELTAAGSDASILAVQGQIGGGSYSTVKRYLDEWKREQAAATPTLDLPPEVAARAAELARALWGLAHTQAEQRVAALRAEAEQQLGRSRAELQAAELTISRLEGEAEQAAQQLEAAQQQFAAAQAATEEARTAARVAEARAGEQERQIAELQRQLAQHGAELDAARAQALDAARLHGELGALRQQLQEQAALIERLSRR